MTTKKNETIKINTTKNKKKAMIESKEDINHINIVFFSKLYFLKK
jgi:hypothetical protein